ncbi:hypothetical protein [Flavobacterium sp.]|uniref:hypothetical protein n=1 Tax=Flavobacterium sp. TaxID=239 RepID=UPI0032654144
MEVKYVNASESTLEINKVLLKITSRRSLKLSILLIVIGLGISVYGAIHSEEFSKTESLQSESNVQILTISHYSNRHVAEAFGGIMFIGGILLLWFNSLKKKVFLTYTDKASKRFLETDNELLIDINEEYVEYKSLDFQMKINWIKFSSYRIYKNFIFLQLENHVTVVTIDKRLLSQSDLKILIGLFNLNDLKELNK